MQLISLIAIYFVVWWICLFLVLPFGVRNQVDTGEIVAGTEPGAPALLKFWPKLLAVTILAAIISGLLYWLLGNSTLQAYWS